MEDPHFLYHLCGNGRSPRGVTPDDRRPKGVAAPLTLYAVSGIRGAHHLCLPTQTETLVPLPQALDVRYTILEGKFTGSTMYGGRVVKLATRMAELHVDQPVAAFSNLKLHLLHPTGEMVPGELFAKVIGILPEEASSIVVSFTSSPRQPGCFWTPCGGMNITSSIEPNKSEAHRANQ